MKKALEIHCAGCGAEFSGPFIFFAWGDVDDDGRVLVIRRVILYFGEKMTMIRWGKRLLEEFTHSAISNNF